MDIPNFVYPYYLLDSIFSTEGNDTSNFPHTDLANI